MLWTPIFTRNFQQKSWVGSEMSKLSVLDGLEKEEVFVVEKDQDGVTRVHGARDVVGLRRDGNLQKQYRSRVIGGLPTFG